MENNFANSINNAFYFVVDAILDLQEYFLREAKEIGSVVFVIAILSAALNYALTGTGLKENAIKIMKATLFFLIVLAAYPKIIGVISSWTYSMAQQSIYKQVNEYFQEKVRRVIGEGEVIVINPGYNAVESRYNYVHKFTRQIVVTQERDHLGLFSNINLGKEHEHKKTGIKYTTVPPAAAIEIIFVIAKTCIFYADYKEGVIPEFSRILKGLICAGILIFTGVFALLEYLICFLEFMLVSSVGVILFPLSIWEGSKFMSEKFIGAIIGFFMKLLFCNIAIFLMLYGFISIFYIFASPDSVGFNGEADQIIFIVFSCMLFLYICKSAPGLAQSLLTGTPSLSATGAISAATGAVAAAGAVMGYAKTAGKLAEGGAGGLAKAGFNAFGSVTQANAASNAVKELGGSDKQQGAAWRKSMAGSIGTSLKAGALGLTRNLLGDRAPGTNPHSWREKFNQANENGQKMTLSQYANLRKEKGAEIGKNIMK